MRRICKLHNGIVLGTPSLLSLAIIWSKCVSRNSPKVHSGTTKTQPFTHFKLAIIHKLTVFKFVFPFTYLRARKTAVRWPTQQRYPQVVVYKALCDVLRKALEKKWNFTKITCAQTFYFLFVLFKNIGELARTSAEPLRWWSINPLWFIFYHPRSIDFEEKIEGLWTGYTKKKKEKMGEKVIMFLILPDSTVTVLNVDHNYSHSYYTLQNENDFL